MDKKSDKELSFDELYRANFFQFVGYCEKRLYKDKYTAEDVVSETFSILFDKWKSLNSHKEQVLLVWMYNTLDNKCYEYRRKNSKTPEDYDDEKENNRTQHYNLSESEENEKILHYIDEIKKQLTPMDWSVFECIVIKKYSIQESAKYLNITEVTLKVRWCRAKERIKKFIYEILY